MIIAVFVYGQCNLTATGNITHTPCSNCCVGEIEVIASNGTPPYEYTLSDGSSTWGPQAGNTFTDLCPDIYSVTVTDDNNCTFTASNIVVQSLNINASVSIESADECLFVDGTSHFDITSNVPSACSNQSVDFGDGTIINASGLSSVTHVYDEYGYYCVTVYDTTLGCEPAQDHINIFVNPDDCVCPDNYTYEDDYDSYVTISSNTTWTDQDLSFYNGIFVEKGCTLNIVGTTLRFSPKGRIILEEGDASNAGAVLNTYSSGQAYSYLTHIVDPGVCDALYMWE